MSTTQEDTSVISDDEDEGEGSEGCLPSTEMLKQMVELALFQQPGFVDDKGERDYRQIDDRLFELVAPAIVESKGERNKKAIGVNKIIMELWSHLVTPDQASSQPDGGVLARHLWKQAKSVVWSELRMGHTGKVQRLIKQRLRDHSYLICRYDKKVGDGFEEAVYLTRHLGCLKDDWIMPMGAKTKNAASTLSKNLAFATEVVPEYADQFDKAYHDTLSTALTAGEGEMAGALMAARSSMSDSESE